MPTSWWAATAVPPSCAAPRCLESELASSSDGTPSVRHNRGFLVTDWRLRPKTQLSNSCPLLTQSGHHCPRYEYRPLGGVDKFEPVTGSSLERRASER